MYGKLYFMNRNDIETQPGCCEDEPNTGQLTVTEAQARILDAVTAIGETESLPLREALDRVLAVDIVSPIDVPSHTNSAMDGYAVRAEDLPVEGVHEFPVPGCLPFAGGAENGRSRCGPAVITPTRRAYEPLRPPKVAQVLATRLVGRKPLCELHDCARERIIHTRRLYRKVGLEQSA